MKCEPMVASLLDTDLYKFNMLKVIFHKHNDLNGTYLFKCRNKDVVFTPEMLGEINAQIDHLCTLRFTKEELEYLRNGIKSSRGNCFLNSDSYIEFLRFWHPRREHVNVGLKNGELSVKVTGPIYSVMMFEIYLLEIINETYFRFKYAKNYNELLDSAMEKLDAKIKAFQDGKYTFRFAEFGCRRRLSREWEDTVVRRFATETKNMVGTSNVYLAMKYNLMPVGTYAHEYVQMYQGISGSAALSNRLAMDEWYDEFEGDNGTALTDTLTTDLFLLDFDYEMASTFTGVRHDSGDPYEWGEKIIKHYEKLGIDPRTKTLLFSDSLDFDKAQKLYDYFKDRINVSFGIGTFVSNDTCVEPLNIVIKLQEVNGKAVAKISDTPGKGMCQDPGYLEWLQDEVAMRISREAN